MYQTFTGLVAAALLVGATASNADEVVENIEVPAEAAPVEPDPAPLEPEANSAAVVESGNGIGNTIIVENDGYPGRATTVISNSRNGIGNRVIIRNGGASVELSDDAPFANMLLPVGNPLARERLAWTECRWNGSMRCWLYWSPDDWTWYRYSPVAKAYYPWYMYPPIR